MDKGMILFLRQLETFRPTQIMERQEVSQGGSCEVGSLDLDVPQLGDGAETSKAIDQSGATTSPRSKPRKQILTEAQKERKRAWTRSRYQDLKEKKRKIALDYYHANKKRVLAQKKARRDSIPNFNKLHYQRIKPIHDERVRRYVASNKEKIKALHKAYLPRRRELCKLRRSQNPSRKLVENLRTRIYMMVRRNSPSMRYRTYEILGCTPDFFRQFLEHQFTPEMTWENYGSYWEIDHVMPLSRFDLEDADQVKLAFHYSNCRPLRGTLNAAKNDSCPGPHQPLLV